jgi:hypothetical protein
MLGIPAGNKHTKKIKKQINKKDYFWCFVFGIIFHLFLAGLKLESMMAWLLLAFLEFKYITK